jgi:hypothetical protein
MYKPPRLQQIAKLPAHDALVLVRNMPVAGSEQLETLPKRAVCPLFKRWSARHGVPPL